MKNLLLQVLGLVAAFLLTGSSLLSAKQHEGGEAATPLPQECAGADLEQLGHPVMAKARNGLLLGLSVGTKKIVRGDEVPLNLWIVNPTDKPLSFMSCDLEWFMKEGFDVYDANQDRVLTIQEQKNQRFRRTAPSCLGAWDCTGNAFLHYPAHSCTKPDHAYGLRPSYALTPGKYTLAIPLDISYCAQRLEGSEPAKVPVGRIPILIEAK